MMDGKYDNIGYTSPCSSFGALQSRMRKTIEYRVIRAKLTKMEELINPVEILRTGVGFLYERLR